MRERVTASDILAGRFGALAPESSRTLEAKHVSLTTAASTPVARPGHRILLSLEIDLGPKMHVYAPGVTGYLPIDWKLEETGAAKAFPFQYPPAQKVNLKVIHETALVYRGRVRITRFCKHRCRGVFQVCRPEAFPQPFRRHAIADSYLARTQITG